MTYRVHERGQYEPPACPGCHRRHEVEWCEVTTVADLAKGERRFIPGMTYCRTEGCRYNDLEQAR